MNRFFFWEINNESIDKLIWSFIKQKVHNTLHLSVMTWPNGTGTDFLLKTFRVTKTFLRVVKEATIAVSYTVPYNHVRTFKSKSSYWLKYRSRGTKGNWQYWNSLRRRWCSMISLSIDDNSYFVCLYSI